MHSSFNGVEIINLKLSICVIKIFNLFFPNKFLIVITKYTALKILFFLIETTTKISSLNSSFICG